MASSFQKVCGFTVHTRTGGLRFSDFSTHFQKVRFQALRFQDLCGRSAKTMQNVRFRKRALSCGRPLRKRNHNNVILSATIVIIFFI